MQGYQLAQETVDLHIPGLYPKQGGSRERMDYGDHVTERR